MSSAVPPSPAVRGMTLKDMKPGEQARVKRCSGEGAVFQRLCEMGFVPGTCVRVVRYAPLGDPMQVELYGYQLSLRKSEAAMIEVEGTGVLEPACGSA